VSAGDPAKQTPFVTNEAVEVPGMMLGPGRYVLKLVEPETERNVLQVFEVLQLWTGDQNRLLSTLLTMPNYDLPTTDKTVFTFFERGPKRPKALRLWFSPGRNYGHEFIYPKAQAGELAKAVGRGVLSLPPELPGDIGRLARTVVEGGPAFAKAPISEPATEPRSPNPSSVTPAPAPPSRAIAQAASPREANTVQHDSPDSHIQSRSRALDRREPDRIASGLPKTASYLPLVALLGILGFVGGALVRVLALRLEQQ